MKRVIGLTGGIASGKSTVVDFLISCGYQVIDADKVVRELQAPGGALHQAILQNFGAEFFDENHQLNRQKLAAVIFSDETARSKLSNLQDAIIRRELYKRRAEFLSNLTEPFFMDIPLLLEENYDGFDEIWLIAVPEAIQLQRVMERDHLDTAAAQARIKAQMPLAQKMALADRIIDSSGSFAQTQAQVRQALAEITKI